MTCFCFDGATRWLAGCPVRLPCPGIVYKPTKTGRQSGPSQSAERHAWRRIWRSAPWIPAAIILHQPHVSSSHGSQALRAVTRKATPRVSPSPSGPARRACPPLVSHTCISCRTGDEGLDVPDITGMIVKAAAAMEHALADATSRKCLPAMSEGARPRGGCCAHLDGGIASSGDMGRAACPRHATCSNTTVRHSRSFFPPSPKKGSSLLHVQSRAPLHPFPPGSSGPHRAWPMRAVWDRPRFTQYCEYRGCILHPIWLPEPADEFPRVPSAGRLPPCFV